MSVHPSLVIRSKLKRPRSVLSRVERLEKLEEDERWDESQSVYGLPKVKVKILKRNASKKAAPEEQAEGEEGQDAESASE